MREETPTYLHTNTHTRRTVFVHIAHFHYSILPMSIWTLNARVSFASTDRAVYTSERRLAHIHSRLQEKNTTETNKIDSKSDWHRAVTRWLVVFVVFRSFSLSSHSICCCLLRWANSVFHSDKYNSSGGSDWFDAIRTRRPSIFIKIDISLTKPTLLQFRCTHIQERRTEKKKEHNERKK